MRELSQVFRKMVQSEAQVGFEGKSAFLIHPAEFERH